MTGFIFRGIDRFSKKFADAGLTRHGTSLRCISHEKKPLRTIRPLRYSNALDAFVKRDTRLAQQVLNEDDRLDALKTQVFRDLLTCMLKDQSTVEPSLDLILVSRHLERIGDHATNIAEDVIFMVSALDVRHHPPTPVED